MQCYEHEPMCLVLENAIRSIEPFAELDRLDVSESLTALGLGSLSDLTALSTPEVAEVARAFPIYA